MNIEETITHLKNGKKMTICTLIRTFKKEGIENFVVTRKKYIETVLSELEKKDTEIIEAKEANRQLSLEIEKKDKVINEMSNFINLMSNELVAEIGDNNLEFCKMQKCIDNGELDCEECIKEYFTKKVEGK